MAERTLFGTDGIRGRANVYPMTPEVMLKLGMAVAAHFGVGGKVVVGKDTRRSGYMFETALASGLCALGAEVLLVGPLPTPGIAYITRSMRADAGVVVSASHNPFEDNGVKLFAADGFKLPDAIELEIEELMASERLENLRVTDGAVGKARRIDDAAGRYVTHLKQAFPGRYDLDGLKIVVDCANGAAYKVAPAVLNELGAQVIALGVKPDGLNINHEQGAMHPEVLARAVREHGADIGVALDGDADRAVFCDASGRVIDGDAIMAICGRELAQRKELRGGSVVATVMSNIGLERSLAEVGVGLIRTPVGDRYVVEAMRESGCNVGGEQSGHLIFLDHATTGDGMIVLLQVLAIMRRTGSALSQLTRVMTHYPQVNRSVQVLRKDPIDRVLRLHRLIRDVERQLGGEGRVLVRYSGTEPKLRVMLEGQHEDTLGRWADEIAQVAREELAAAPA